MHIYVESTLKKGDYYIFCDANFGYNDDTNHCYTKTSYNGVNIPKIIVNGKKVVKKFKKSTKRGGN